MRHHDLLLDILNYNSTIRACDKGWQWHQALGLLEGMRHNYLLPDVISFSSAVASLWVNVQTLNLRRIHS